MKTKKRRKIKETQKGKRDGEDQGREEEEEADEGQQTLVKLLFTAIQGRRES